MNDRHWEKTASLIRRLNSQGIDKLFVVLRHSARNYHEDITMEPFMSLTDKGRAMAFQMGSSLPENFSIRFFSSYIGRCIETAYLLDKGFVKKTGAMTENNRVTDIMAPFYVNDLSKLADIIMSRDLFVFIREWINVHIPESILMPPKEAARKMFKFMVCSLWESEKNTLQISVTHDWNLYLLKEFGLGLAHEEYGKVSYLEGIVLFEQDGKIYITNHQKDPVILDY